MISVAERNEQESDNSSFYKSSTSMENTKKTSARVKRSNSRNRFVTSWKNPQIKVSRKISLVESLKDKVTQSTSATKHDAAGNSYNYGAHSVNLDELGRYNKVKTENPKILQQQVNRNRKEKSSSGKVFPFEKTPSGNFKLMPHQLLYNSKNFGILAADPQKVVLNVTNLTDTDNDGMYSRIENQGKVTHMFSNTKEKVVLPIHSELSDSTIRSEEGSHKETLSPEISLARMGFVTDNCIEWSKIQMPKKNDWIKLLKQNITNKVNPDIRIKFGDNKHSFDCHRIVLQCYSAFFSTVSENVMELPADVVSKEIFSLIYQWMLDQDTESHRMIRRDNVLNIYKASCHLKIIELEKQCLAFMENSEVFFEDKAFLLYLEARKHGNKKIMNLMVPRVQRFFLTLVSSKEFVELTFEEVRAFLNSDFASVHNETEMLMSGVRWLSHDWSARHLLTVDIMHCIRFQFIDSKSLLVLRRTKQPPEIKRVMVIPEVVQMIDDAIAFHAIIGSNKNLPDESIDMELRKMNLSRRAPRNWTRTNKDCQGYNEFLRELSCYRSKHRMEAKKSKIDMRTRVLDDDDFLKNAVLPENVHQSLSQQKNGDASQPHIPRLPPKEHRGFKKVLRDEGSSKGERTQTKPKRQDTTSPSPGGSIVEAQKQIADGLVRMSNKEELDKAAQKIQRAYRGYTMRKTPSKHSEVRSSKHSEVRSSKHSEVRSSKSILEMHTGVETVFTFGGFDPFVNPQAVHSGSAVYRYELATNRWEWCGDLPEPRHYHGACLYRGKIYVAGGKHPSYVTDESVSRKVWCYDPDYRAWTRVADLIRPRRGFGLVVCRNRMFAIGGRDDKSRVLSSVEKYDPDNDCWTQVRRLLEPRTGAGVCEFEGYIWVAGGFTHSDCEGSCSVERYDPCADIWSFHAPLRYITVFPTLIPMDGRLYLVAGAIGHEHIVGSGRHIDVLDQRSNSWCLSSKLVLCRHAHACAFLRGVPPGEPGHLLVLGGIVSRRNASTAKVECWRPCDDGRVTGVASLPAPVCGFPALVLPCRTF